MPNYNLADVLPLGVLTGSRAFNCATAESDWDIVILEANLPDYKETPDYTCTDFVNDPITGDYRCNKTKLGHDVSEYSEFDDEGGFIEYDQATIWGPLIQIIKYWDDDGNCINLFVYENSNKSILDKFKQVANLMNFLHNVKLQDKSYRIEAFKCILLHLGITPKPTKKDIL